MSIACLNNQDVIDRGTDFIHYKISDMFYGLTMYKDEYA